MNPRVLNEEEKEMAHTHRMGCGRYNINRQSYSFSHRVSLLLSTKDIAFRMNKIYCIWIWHDPARFFWFPADISYTNPVKISDEIRLSAFYALFVKDLDLENLVGD